MTQTQTIARLISRKRGATPAEMIAATFSTSVHSRMSELKARGWRIWREQVQGRNFGRYFGQFEGKTCR